MNAEELTAEERAVIESPEPGLRRASAKLLRLYDAALARTEAAEQDLNWLRLTANAAEERTAANVRDKDSAITRLGMVEAQHRAAESALAEATALLERAARIVENDDWRDAYDRWRSGCTFAADGSAEYSRTPSASSEG